MTTPDRQQNVLATILTVLLALSLVAGLVLLGSAAYRVYMVVPPAPTGPPPTPVPVTSDTPLPSATPEPTATPTPRPTATPTLKPTSPPVAVSGSCNELLADGGFETGNGWTLVETAQTAGYVNQPAAYVSKPVRSGLRAVRVGIDGSRNLYSYSAVDQTVTIPADATSATLSYWALPLCGAVDNDVQYVLVLKGGGTFDVLYWEQRNATDWQRFEFPLDAYRGQEVTIRFGTRNDGQGDASAMYVDDVSLTVCYEVTPTPYPS